MNGNLHLKVPKNHTFGTQTNPGRVLFIEVSPVHLQKKNKELCVYKIGSAGFRTQGRSSRKYLSLSFDLSQILSQSHCSDW